MNQLNAQVCESAEVDSEKDDVAALSMEQLQLIAGGECVLNGF